MAKILKLLILLVLLLGAAGRCQPAPGEVAPTSFPAPGSTPTLVLPVKRGDGSDLLDRLLDAGVIRVGLRVWPSAEFSPPAFRGFSNAETGGALNGFEVDVARLVATGLGLELELVEAYPPVLAGGDWRGQWDVAIASLAPFDEPPIPVTAPLFFSEPYGYLPLALLVPASAGDSPRLEDLTGQKVGVLEDSAGQFLLGAPGQPLTALGRPVLDRKLPAGLEPVAVSNLLKAIHDLGQPGQPDALFGPAPVFQEAVKSELPVKVVAGPLGYQPLAVAVISQDGLKVDRLLQEINKVLERHRRRGTLAEMYLRWYGQDYSQAP